MIFALDGTAISVTAITAFSVILTGYFTYRGVVLKMRSDQADAHAALGAKVDKVQKTVTNGLHDAMVRLEEMVADLKATQEVSVSMDERPVFRTSPHGGLIWANDAAVTLLGMSLADLQEDGWAKAVHPDDAERVFSSWKESVAARGTYGPVVYRYRHPGTDEITWVKAVAQPIENKRTQELTGWVATVVEIPAPLEPS